MLDPAVDFALEYGRVGCAGAVYEAAGRVAQRRHDRLHGGAVVLGGRE